MLEKDKGYYVTLSSHDFERRNEMTTEWNIKITVSDQWVAHDFGDDPAELDKKIGALIKELLPYAEAKDLIITVTHPTAEELDNARDRHDRSCKEGK